MMRKLLLACAALLVANGALAATTPNSIVTPQTPNLGLVQFSANPGTYLTLYTAGSNGSKCVAVYETNTDASVTHLINVVVTRSSTKYNIVAVTTAVNDGNANGTPAKQLLSQSLVPGTPLDSDGNPFIILNSGDTLQATYATALTATDVISLVAVCEDF
jgi:hypothetical protein